MKGLVVILALSKGMSMVDGRIVGLYRLLPPPFINSPF